MLLGPTLRLYRFDIIRISAVNYSLTANCDYSFTWNLLPPPSCAAPRAFSTPSVAAYHGLIHVFARAGDWPALFDMVARLEKIVEEGLARPAALSVHR